MTTWNSGPYPDPNQGYYAGQQPPYPGAGGYPPPPPTMGGYPGGPPPPTGYGGYGGPPPAGFAPSAPGFQPFVGGPTPMSPSGERTHLPNSSPHAMYGGANAAAFSDDPNSNAKGFDFSEMSVRRGFIRRVYSILMVQLLITMGFISLFVFHEPTKRYVQQTPALMIIAMVVLFASMIALACCGELRRKFPMNFILLFVFTVAEGFVLGIVSSTYNANEVLMAVGITAAVCLALTLFAFQTKYDFTMCGGVLIVAVVILLIFGIVTIFIPHNRIVRLVYASLGALIFSVYLIYDTQLMMGGKHKYSISPEEYIFASLNLYVDIVNIFMYILAIIGSSRD